MCMTLLSMSLTVSVFVVLTLLAICSYGFFVKCTRYTCCDMSQHFYKLTQGIPIVVILIQFNNNGRYSDEIPLLYIQHQDFQKNLTPLFLTRISNHRRWVLNCQNIYVLVAMHMHMCQFIPKENHVFLRREASFYRLAYVCNVSFCYLVKVQISSFCVCQSIYKLLYATISNKL